MRMYYGLAGRESVIRMEALRDEHVLESFYYPIHPKWRSAYKTMFLDSGAFTAWKKWEYLDIMMNYEHISLGCTEKTSTTPSVGRWLRECFERICDADGFPRVKVHGFRFTSWMDTFPFFSVDSTTWCQSSHPYSFATLSQTFPFLQPLEIGQIVKRYYERRPQATRLVPEKVEEETLPLFTGVLQDA